MWQNLHLHTSSRPPNTAPAQKDTDKGALESQLCNRDDAGQPGRPEAGAEIRDRRRPRTCCNTRGANLPASGSRALWRQKAGKTGRRDGCTY